MSVYTMRNFGAGDPSALARIKDWVQEQFGPSATRVVTVSEAACALDGCDPRETVIAIWDCGARATFKIGKAASSVTRSDIAGLSEMGAVFSGPVHDPH